jgi:hypothetical protein
MSGKVFSEEVMAEDPVNLSSSASDGRRREHARRDAMQEDLLRRAYQRSVHRSYIEAALRRTGYSVLSIESASAYPPRIRKID